MSLTADWTYRDDRVLLLLNLTSLDPSVAILSKVSWMNEFMMFMAFLEIPMSGCTCFNTLQMQMEKVQTLLLLAFLSATGLVALAQVGFFPILQIIILQIQTQLLRFQIYQITFSFYLIMIGQQINHISLMGFFFDQIYLRNKLIKVSQFCTYLVSNFTFTIELQQFLMCQVTLSFLEEAQIGQILKLKLKQTSHPAHPYYCCYEAEIKGKRVNVFKLVGPANPFLPLLQLYLLFATPTQNIITRQFILFMIKCWRVYKKSKHQQHFKKQFYSFCSPYSQSKPTQNAQINKLIDKIMIMNEDGLIKLQEQAIRNPQYQPKYSHQSKLNLKDFESKQLNNLIIVPQALKYKLLKYFAQSFMHEWGIKLLFDKSRNNFYIMAETYTNNNKMVNMEQFIYEANCQEPRLASSQQMQELCFSLCKNIDVFNNEIELIFRSEAPEIQIPYYHPNFTNVFIQIKKTNQGYYILGERGCSLDYIQPVLRLVGLKNKPMTVENYLLFYSTPKPYTFHLHYKNVLSQKFKITDDKVLEQNQITIKWLLICDHLLTRALKQQGQSALQICPSKKAIIQQIFIQRKYLHHQTKAIIDLLQLGGQQELSESSLLKNLKLSKIHEISHYNNIGISEEQKYGLVKSSIDFQQLLFSQEEGLKHFGQKSKLQHFTSKFKYICLYLFAKYAQLFTQVQFLQVWTGQQVNLLDPKYKINQFMRKFIIVCDKIQNKFKPSNDQTDKLLQSSIKLYLSLKETPFPFQFRNSQYENRKAKIKAIDKLLKQIKQTLDLIFALLKTDISKIQENDKAIYLVARKNVCYKQMFLNLTFFNYSSFICQQIKIADFKPSLKDISIKELQQTFDNFDKEIQQMVVEDKHFFSQTNPLSQSLI